MVVLTLATACSDGECESVTFADQCADRSVLWQEIDADAGVADRCPSKAELERALVHAYEVGLQGGPWESEPTASGTSCCYTTRSVPCE